MTIANGRGITSYPRFQQTRIEGGPTRARGLRAVLGCANPILVQLHKILIGGTASDGNYVTTIVDDQTGETWVVTTVRATTPSSNADIAAQHAADINALQGLNGVVNAVINGTTAEQVDLTFLHPGITYTVTCTETTATGTITPTKLQTAGGANRKLARAVRSSSFLSGQHVIADLATTSLAADVIGMTLRPQAAGPHNLGSVLAADVDQWISPQAVDVIEEGYAAAKNVSSVAAVARAPVYVVRATTGGDELGQFRSDAEGVAHVVEAAPTAANSTDYVLEIELVDESTGKVVGSHTAFYTSDASATDAEIVDGLIADIDLSELVLSLGVTTANVSDDLEITAPLGYRLNVVNTGTGTLAVADVTAFAMYTIRMDAWKWQEPVAASGVGEVYFGR